MRILLCCDAIFPDERGGSCRIAWDLARFLGDAGHEVTVLTRRKEGFKKEERVSGIRILRFQSGRFLGTLRGILEARRILRLLGEVDVIIFNQPHSAIPVLLAGRLKDVPKIYIYYSPWAEEYEIRHRTDLVGRKLRERLERWTLSRSQHIIVLSRFIEERLLTHHPKLRVPVTMAPAGVDLGRFRPLEDPESRKILRGKLGISPERFLMFTVRNLEARMGLENLLLAMASFAPTHPDAFLIIGGSGSLEKPLKEKCRALGLEGSVRFEGDISEEELPKFFQACDIFVLPTERLEGFGLVTIEALACGIPVLATPVGATPEILAGLKECWMTKSAQAPALAESLREAYAERSTFGPRGKACRRFVEARYSFESFAESVETLLKNPLSLKRRG